MTNSPADHDHGPGDNAAVVPDSDRVARLLAPSSAARRKRSLFSACGPSSTRPPSIAQDPHKYPRVGRPIRSSSIAYSALIDDDLHDVLDGAGANEPHHPTTDDDGKTITTHGAPFAAAAFASNTTNADRAKGDESAPVPAANNNDDSESAYSATIDDDSSTDIDVSTVSSHRSSLLDLLSASATSKSAPVAAPTTPTAPGCCPVQLPSPSLRLFRRVLNHHRHLLLRSSKMASTLAAPLMPPSSQRSLPAPPPPRHVFEESDVLSSDDDDDADTECLGREWDLPPSPPMSPAGEPRPRPRAVSFAPDVEVRYTFAPGEYDRNPIDPPPMSARDYYEYQVIAFEMHQAIKFELTMRQLGIWAPAAPTVPTIPVVASTLERRREVQDTFARGTKVLVAKPRGQSLQYSQVNRAQVAAAMASAESKAPSETASTVLDISLQA
ncbi:hypothetical protein AMAG_05251 [Allomyces macrogynus ATCC 38327]|uniref:Uncharacterized protein n=1 Tax=Allomyces macrogynus (strain ATCC 38327) TaxID=578462 RepID=A0A0L0SBI1_ALLM3|nr:hypothetical protein AMAG_05251 [Allomyces macrogynus ATCC 38327]|eukprot:KNE59792.1 hypothetical protein AMAG_05251 [Allomyces macrogynus ATCC 38327]